MTDNNFLPECEGLPLPMPGFAIVRPKAKPRSSGDVQLAVVSTDLPRGIVVASGAPLLDDYGEAFRVFPGEEVCYAMAEQDSIPGFPDLRLVKHGHIRMKMWRMPFPLGSEALTPPTSTEVELWKLLAELENIADGDGFRDAVLAIAGRRNQYLQNIPEYGIVRV